MSKLTIDDGFRADLVEKAKFDGILEIPTIFKPKEYRIPSGMVPFTCRNRAAGENNFLVFYEHDLRFGDVLTATDQYVEDFRRFSGVVSPDCSLYRDMPLCLQIVNVYMNRAVGHSLQEQGLYVVPNVRWGDERTYTTEVLPEKIAFLGVEKNSIVSIGTYGCVRGEQNRYHFRNGLIAMLDTLEPEIVLVYGPTPDNIFHGLESKTRFIQYPDWISLKKRR